MILHVRHTHIMYIYIYVCVCVRELQSNVLYMSVNVKVSVFGLLAPACYRFSTSIS